MPAQRALKSQDLIDRVLAAARHIHATKPGTVSTNSIRGYGVRSATGNLQAAIRLLIETGELPEDCTPRGRDIAERAAIPQPDRGPVVHPRPEKTRPKEANELLRFCWPRDPVRWYKATYPHLYYQRR